MNTYIVKLHQSLLDIAITVYGRIEGVYEILRANPFLHGPTDNVYPKDTLHIPPWTQSHLHIKRYVQAYTIATLTSQEERSTGIGWYVIEPTKENTFIIH